MRKLAILIVRHRWLVIVIALIAMPVAAIVGGGVHERLSSGGFEDPSTESAHAKAELKRSFPQSSLSDFVLVVTAKHGNVDDPAVTKAATAIAKDLASRRGVVAVGSYWTYGKVEQLRSRNSHQALIVAAMSGEESPRFKRAGELAEVFTIDNGTLSTEATGEAVLTHQISERARTDLERSELLTAPFTAIALVIVFGSIVAALLPLAVGVFAVVGTLLVLLALTFMTDISVFALNLTTAMGLGLGIDYSLFIVSRYREELAKGASTNVAVGRSMQTAGRTVLFSAGTVMVSLSALAVFDVPYLRSFAFAGVAVVALGGDRGGRDPPRRARDPRTSRREGPDLQAQAGVRDRRLLGRAGPAGDEAPGALRARRELGAGPARGAVLQPEPRPHRRPGRAADRERSPRGRPDPRELRDRAKPTRSRSRCRRSGSPATPPP